MKKIIIGSFLALTAFTACTDEDYANLNVDPKNPSEVPGSFLFTNGIKSLFDQLGNTSVNRNIFRLVAQHWAQTQYIDESNFNLRNRSIPDTHWNTMYGNVLYDLKKAKESVENDPLLFPGEKKNQAAIISLVEIYAWQNLVDLFGNVPYTEALAGVEGTKPKYDDAQTIYKDLLVKVAQASSQFDAASPGFSNDFVYGGDFSKWKKFAASLRFKLAMRIADSDPALSKTEAEAAYNAGLMASNDDNFILKYEGNTANANPLYADLVLSGRADFIPSDTFVDYLNDLEDPRRTVFLDDNQDSYIGGDFGGFNTYTEFTHIGKVFYEQSLKGDLMDFSEISFLLAEAKERGYNVGGSTAAAYYTQAVTASMEYWGIPASSIAAYLAKPEVAYATAPGTWKEKIGKQFWIAMYNRGFEAWTVWRKYDAPGLDVASGSSNPVPNRFTYPIRERNLNGTNYTEASSAIGGDEQKTKIFWDKF